ncbi:hypothetical protein KEJ21_00455 [Candidatus Bathyarchaeota archaeon]|nr:hypothetical protein [Candidatus Bathyarchaeota archaeon]MBS7630032.1 hypothetical protein [Candidatus Bathyarchaeota archaeon]
MFKPVLNLTLMEITLFPIVPLILELIQALVAITVSHRKKQDARLLIVLPLAVLFIDQYNILIRFYAYCLKFRRKTFMVMD